MQSYCKTAEKKGLCLWKAQSTASDISPEWRERTQCSLASPFKFPILNTGEALLLSPTVITHYRRTSHSFPPEQTTSIGPQELRIPDIASSQGTNQNKKGRKLRPIGSEVAPNISQKEETSALYTCELAH